MGVLESLKVRKQSYPVRYYYKVFVRKYSSVDSRLKRFDLLDEENADMRAITEYLFQ